jgi:hypothetical protein
MDLVCQSDQRLLWSWLPKCSRRACSGGSDLLVVSRLLSGCNGWWFQWNLFDDSYHYKGPKHVRATRCLKSKNWNLMDWLYLSSH